jgi:hypothetical protein
MIHVFRLGPIGVADGDAFTYAGVADDGDLVAPEASHDDATGLKKIASRLAGKEWCCEPALAEAARALGIASAEFPAHALVPRAVLAYGLGLGKVSGRPRLGVLLRFLEACATFWKARPWEVVDSSIGLPAALAIDGRTRHLEAAVMGAGGEEYGVALYDEMGSVNRILAASPGDRQVVQKTTGTAVTFDKEPAWAAAAIEDAFGLPRLPVPLRIRKGAASSPTSDELHVLAAALEAAAHLPTVQDLDDASSSIEVDGRMVTLRLTIPDLDDDAHEPMLVADPAATSRSGTPRNAPCPCGSGKKYKKCHLELDEEQARRARGTGPGAEESRADAKRRAERDPIHGFDERITADALALARQRWGRAFDPEGTLAGLGLDPAVGGYMSGWHVAHYGGPDGRTALDLYVEERGGGLDEAGKRYVEAQRGAWFSYQEVVATKPGESVTLRDLLAGGERMVTEKTASRTLLPRAVILGRVLDLGGRAILAGCHPNALAPRDGAAALERARKALGVRTKVVSAERLHAATAGGDLLRIWQETVDAAEARPLPRLQNTDGEDLLVTVDRFAVAPEKATEIVQGLFELPDARRGEGESSATEVNFVREGNAKGLLPTTHIGRATLEGSALRLESNSVERADRLRKLVEERLGSLVTFRVREHTDPAALLQAGGPPRARAEAPSIPPEVVEAVKALEAEHHRRWLDESIPALGGLTPREAAKRKGGPRKGLELLLAEIEHAEATRPPEQRFDVDELWRALGLR